MSPFAAGHLTWTPESREWPRDNGMCLGLGQPEPDCSLVQFSCGALEAPTGQWPSHAHGSTRSHLSVRLSPELQVHSTCLGYSQGEASHEVSPSSASACCSSTLHAPVTCAHHLVALGRSSVFSSVKGTYSPPAAHWREGWGGHAHGYGDSSKWCYSGGAMDTNLDGPGCPTPHLTHLSYILQGPSSWLL